MCKALLIAAIGMGVLGQTGEGVVTSTDLMAPDVSASERGREAPLPHQEVPAASSGREEAPVVREREADERPEQPREPEREPTAQPSPRPRAAASDEGRDHKAVAAFWFILPES